MNQENKNLVSRFSNPLFFIRTVRHWNKLIIQRLDRSFTNPINNYPPIVKLSYKNYLEINTVSAIHDTTLSCTDSSQYVNGFQNNLNNVNYCFFIDRKIKQGYTYPRIISVKYRFSDDVFNDTLFDGELVKDKNNNWMFLIHNLIQPFHTLN